MSDDTVDVGEKEAAYLDNITKRKQQKFASKAFGGGLEAAREGKSPVHHGHHDMRTGNTGPTSPRSPSQTYGGGPSYGSPSHNSSNHYGGSTSNYSSPSQPVNPQPVRKWDQPKETIVHEPVNRQPTQAYGEIETKSILGKRDESDLEEALRKEEERMNKKLSHTAPVGTVIAGLQGPQNHHSGIYGGPVSPRHNTSSHNPVSPRGNSSHWAQPTPVHAHTTHSQPVNASPNRSGQNCSCGTFLATGTKFCPECGKSCGPSSPTQGYTQNSAPSGRYGEIETTSMVSKKDDSDIEEALRREEERMNKKLGNTAPQNSGAQVTYGGLQPAQQQQHHQQQQYQQPVHQPVHQPRPQYQIQETVVEQVVKPIQNMNLGLKGPGVFCTYDVPGNASSNDERPKMSVDQSSSYLFTPVPGKLGVNVECLIEGTDCIKFKLTTTANAVVVQKYSMPFPIGREHLKRKGDSVELDPF